MTLDQLKVLHAIIETGSFRAAAESLHRAQSAVSYAVKNLEDEFHLMIFDRTGYRPTLTESGKAIYEKSKIILLQTEELLQLGHHLSQGKEAEIHLAINAICPLSSIIKIINQFSQEHPSVQIKLNIENLGGAVERVLDGNADIALAESIGWHDQLDGIPWTKIKFLPVASPHFPPASQSAPLTKSDMIQYVQIIVADSVKHSEAKTVGVLKEGLHWTVNDFAVKKQLLLSNSGWGLMPQHMVAAELKNNQLIVLDYQPFADMTVDFFLLRKKDKLLGPMASQLWSHFSQLCEGYIDISAQL